VICQTTAKMHRSSVSLSRQTWTRSGLASLVVLACLFQELGLSLASTTTKIKPSTGSSSSAIIERPKLVTESLENNKDIYYFGLGSNMLRSKLEGRAICGTKIHVKSMEPAYVKNHRLAFNMRGFPPLEPGMGSLEPVAAASSTTTTRRRVDNETSNSNVSSKPLLAYKEPECHGALIKLSAQDYERVMRSEGVPGPNQGYEEVVVEAVPYTKPRFPYHRRQRPVQAVALRARESVRLLQDPAPSKRYMSILQKGARELGLEESYQEFLQQHPVATSWSLTKRIAVLNLVLTSKLSFQYKIRSISKFQNWCLWKVYCPPTVNNRFIRMLHELATIFILLPVAIPGLVLFWYMKLQNSMTPMMKLLVEEHW
jgi:hypothetical protein